MSESKSIPRLLQRPRSDADRESDPESEAGADAGPSAEGSEMDKGDRKSLVDKPKPNREHEVGDLERAERDDHGKASG